MLLCQFRVPSRRTRYEKGLPPLLVLAAGLVFLEEADRVSVEGEGDFVDVDLFALLHVAVLGELVAPHLVRARLEVEQRRLVRVDDDRASCVAVRAEPGAEPAPAGRLAIGVREKRVDVEAEEVDIREDALDGQLLRDGLHVLQHDARDRRPRLLHELRKGHLEVEQLVVVDVEQPDG